MNDKFPKKIFAIAIIFFLVCFFVIPNIYGDINTKMGCDPSSNNVTVGDTFTVTVWLDANQTVDSWLVDLFSYNTTIRGMVNATQVTIGSFWQSGFYDTGTIDNNEGIITGIQAFVTSGTATNTTIFTVDFIALQPGLCNIIIEVAEAYSGGPNVLGQWYNTSVVIHPEEPTNLTTTTISDSRIDLSWTRIGASDRTLIRYRTDTYPTSVTDGTELYNGTSQSTSHTGLSLGDTIYYSAWGWDETSRLYSYNYDTAIGSTITVQASMGCIPSTNYVTVGDTFTVSVWLDANGLAVDSWLVNLLSYNTTVLGMINATQVTIGSLWDTGFYETGIINNNLGRITGIQAFVTTPSVGNTTIFTVEFLALKTGTCNIDIVAAEAYSGGPNVLGPIYDTSVLIYPEEPTNLIANTVNQNTISLTWIKSGSSDRTLIRYRPDTYPTSVIDGTELYNDTGNSTNHIGLNVGDTIYYSAWSWNDTTSLYSLNYTTVLGQTYNLQVTMGCIPSRNNVTINETFTVMVWLNANGINVDSWLVDRLTYDTTILGLINATRVTIGNFWRTGFYDNGTIDNNLGRITGIQAFSTTGAISNTTLFTVEFIALRPGTCNINLAIAEAYSGGPNVLDNRYNTSIIITEEPGPEPEINIIKPQKGYLYYFDQLGIRLFPDMILIIGHIVVDVEVNSPTEIERVEFYIDDELMDTEYEDAHGVYSWRWDEYVLFYHHIIIVAYDIYGNTASEILETLVFNFNLIP